MAAAKTVDQEMDESLALAVQYLPLVVSGLTRCRELGARPLSHTEDDIQAVGKRVVAMAHGLTATICKADGGETLRSALAVRPPNEPEKPAAWTSDIPPRGVETPPTGTVFNQTKKGFRDGWWYCPGPSFKEDGGRTCPNVSWVGRYAYDERVGYWEETSEDGNVLYGFYVDGKKDGVWAEPRRDFVRVMTYTNGSFKGLKTVFILQKLGE